MPLVDQPYISFYQVAFNIPQLSQIISKIEHMNAQHHRTSIFFSTNKSSSNIISDTYRRDPNLLLFSVEQHAMLRNWQASQVLHICGQLSPFTSSVERLGIYGEVRVRRSAAIFARSDGHRAMGGTTWAFQERAGPAIAVHIGQLGHWHRTCSGRLYQVCPLRNID